MQVKTSPVEYAGLMDSGLHAIEKRKYIDTKTGSSKNSS